MLINFEDWKHKIKTSQNKELYILVINIIVSLISCSTCFLFFYLIKEKSIYKTGMFENFLSAILILILYCYLSIQTNIYLRKKFSIINSPIDLLKQFFSIICSSFLWMIIIYLFFDGFDNKKSFKDLMELSLSLLIPSLIFYTIHLITYKLKQFFNNIVFEKLIFIVLNTLLLFFTLEITATIITIFDISKIYIIFIVPILFAGMFSFQFALLNKILCTFDIKKVNSNKDITICTLISSIIYLISIANEIMFTVLKADFESAKLIVFWFLFIYSLIMCAKTKILKPIIFIILFIYIVISVWNFKLNDFKPLNNYQKIKKEIWKEYAIKHFPKDIPLNAKNVEYDYYQNTFFGSEGIYLVFTADSTYIYNELKKYNYNEIIESCDFLGNYNSLYCMSGYTMDKFKVFPIESNEKYAYGFAVNKESNQIMYFYNYPD